MLILIVACSESRDPTFVLDKGFVMLVSLLTILASLNPPDTFFAGYRCFKELKKCSRKVDTNVALILGPDVSRFHTRLALKAILCM